LRCIFYGTPGESASEGIVALADGARASGHRVIWRNHNFFRPGEYEPADLFVVTGLQGPIGLFPAEARKRGRRTLVVDLAMLCRGRTYGLGLEKTNWVPPYDCDERRLDHLGIVLEPHVPGTGSHILVAEQSPNDVAHGMDKTGLDAWLERTTRELEAAGRKYRVRPHPRVRTPARSLEEDLLGASAVVTLTSNVGHDALRGGIPVFCRKDAPYASLGNVYDERSMRPFDKRPYFPGEARRRQYFARLAHAEWDVAEMRSGEALDFAMTTIQKEADGDEPDALPPDEDGDGDEEGMQAAPRRRGRPPKGSSRTGAEAAASIGA
jgi:hypothetical protein